MCIFFNWKMESKVLEINPILVTFGSSQVLNEIFPDKLWGRRMHFVWILECVARSLWRKYFNFDQKYFRLVIIVVSVSGGKCFFNCMKLSQWLRPAGLPTAIITVLKSRAKLEKRLIIGDNDGHYDKLCRFQLWRVAHVSLCPSIFWID